MAPPNAANALDARLDVRTRQTSAMGLKGCLLFTERPDGDTSEVPFVAFQNLSDHKFIGCGTFCEVYLCKLSEDEGRVRTVAVKMLKDEHITNRLARDDISSEAELLYKLKHKNILRVYGKGEKYGRLFMVLDLLESVLSETLPPPQEGPLRSLAIRQWTQRRALRCALELAEAMCYCHYHAIPGFAVLHRDLKPDNIGFAADGTVRLFDFGLAKLVPVPEGKATEPISMSGQTGSARYMAPEVALSKPYHRPADVYSWAHIVWQIFSHAKPYECMEFEEHHQKVILDGERPPLGESLPSELKGILTQSWHVDQAERPGFDKLVVHMKNLLAAAEEEGDLCKLDHWETGSEAAASAGCFGCLGRSRGKSNGNNAKKMHSA